MSDFGSPSPRPARPKLEHQLSDSIIPALDPTDESLSLDEQCAMADYMKRILGEAGGESSPTASSPSAISEKLSPACKTPSTPHDPNQLIDVDTAFRLAASEADQVSEGAAK